MGSRRGRLNWSNLEVHISDEIIEKQHCFARSNSVLPAPISTDHIIEEEEEEKETSSAPPPTKKRTWMPKMGVGDMQAEQFIGNFMLTNAEQTAIEKKYNEKTNHVECTKVPLVSKSIRISSRLSSMRETPLSTRITNLYVGQHLLNVFVCHVESYSCVYIMFGDDYNRATKLFQDMNSCDELLRPLSIHFEPKEKDLVALYHEKKWFRGQYLNSTDANVNVLCLDSGVIMTCPRNNIRRLPDKFRTCSPCCIECSLSGLPPTMTVDSMPDSIHNECLDLLYKDRYEAIVTRVDTSNRPTLVLYYGNENVNDQLLTILKVL